MNTVLTLILLSLSTPGQVLVERAFFVMGTTLEFKVYCEDEKVCNKAIFEAYSEVKKLDDIFSNYKDDSVLSKVNSLAGEGRVSVPKEFIKLTDYSLHLSSLTDGAFDITVGRTMELWKTAAEKNELPKPEEVEKLKGCVGYEKVKLYNQERQIELESPCLSLDFGGIGKGYAVDQAASVLIRHGIKRGLINFSGNMYAMEPPPGEDGWTVAVKHPRDESKVLAQLKIKDMAVSTSGDYERYFEIKGKRFSHIVDPRTGMPVESVPSVTVVSESATAVDAFSTAFSVMGRDETFKFLEKLDGLGVMMITEKEGSLSIYKSSLFEQFEVPRSQLEKSEGAEAGEGNSSE